MMKLVECLIFIFFLLIIPSSLFSLPIDPISFPSSSSFSDDYELVWSDEFNQPDGSPPNPNVWNYVIGPDSSGNNQVQYFTDSINNSFIENQQLVIQAIQENYKGCNFTSASLNTKGKVSFFYGLTAIRARIRMFDGAWPAFSMEGSASLPFPRSGYVDIFEQINGRGTGALDDSIQFATLHYNLEGENSSHIQHQQIGGNITAKPNHYWGDEFHLYQGLWTNSTYTFLLDDLVYLTVNLTSAIGFNSYLDPTNPFFFNFEFCVRWELAR